MSAVRAVPARPKLSPFTDVTGKEAPRMLTVRIMNEFLHGPVWVLDDQGISVSPGTLPLVDQDPIVRELNKEAGALFDSYYEFDSHGDPCWFDENRQRADAGRMLALVTRLKARLAEINDGSYVVEDLETPFLSSL